MVRLKRNNENLHSTQDMRKRAPVSFRDRSMFIWLSVIFMLSSGCGEDPVTEVNFEDVKFAPFVEREFPFVTTSLLIARENELFPENNVVSRCLALILGRDAYACFDTEMLRWAAAWTGEFIPLEGVAHKSYPEFLGRNRKMSYLTESPHLVTGLYPGWNVGEPLITDPRKPSPHPDEPSWGPLPQEEWRWNGVYLTNDKPVLSYSVGNVEIHEVPGSIESGANTVFTRTINIQNPDKELSVIAAEIPDAVKTEVSPGRVVIHHDDGGNITIVTLSTTRDAVRLDVKDGRYVFAKTVRQESPLEFTLQIWSGDQNRVEEVENLVNESTFELPRFRDGGPNLWPETVRTRGKIAADTAAFVIDELTLPIPNPWDRNVRVVDIDFFDDRRAGFFSAYRRKAAVVTFDGDVWVVRGISRNLKNIRWQRFASGLYEPQSIEIVNNQIYVYGKDGIIRLHDLNDNGFADYYENFNNLIEQSIETREWASDMVAKPSGGFYVAKGAALDMGPKALTDPVIRGVRAGSNHSGVILEISENGRELNMVAGGFRGPYLGIHPESGLLTATDQEGHHVPSTPIFTVNHGDYYGVPATAHRDSIPDITQPLLWIPHNVDRSGISQTWITGGKMGPLNDQLIHFSYGRPGLFQILMDSTDSGVQGGITLIEANYPVPTMKGTVSPHDGQLYIGGFTLWGTNSDGMTGLLRLRFTGEKSYQPKAFSARNGGIVLRFHEPLNENAIDDITNYRVERWNYLRTEEYGSGHFRLNGSPGQEILPVYSAHISDDHKAVYLAVPNIIKTDQMQIDYQLEFQDGTSVDDMIWVTVHYADPIDLPGEGFSGLQVDELLAVESHLEKENKVEQEVSAERGRELFRRTGCMGCHTTDGSVGTGVGPTLKGLYGSVSTFRDGSETIADEEYILNKLYYPAESIVEGYDEGMPSFLGILSDDEAESIILFLKMLDD